MDDPGAQAVSIVDENDEVLVVKYFTKEEILDLPDDQVTSSVKSIVEKYV